MTSSGIHIGSTESEVIKAYGRYRDQESTKKGKRFVAGSIYDGMILISRTARSRKYFSEPPPNKPCFRQYRSDSEFRFDIFNEGCFAGDFFFFCRGRDFAFAFFVVVVDFDYFLAG